MTDKLTRFLQAQIPFWLVLPIIGAVLAIGIGSGYLLALEATSPCPLRQEECRELDNFWRVWRIATDNFVDPQAARPAAMTDGAIEGLLDSLGDVGHTTYLPPEVAQAERERLTGSFEGIGAYIDVRDGQPLIVEPIEGSPAERAGLRSDDLIMAVNGEEVRGVTIGELRNLVRGPKGTTVTLTIQREGVAESFDIAVVRDEVRLLSVSWRLLAGDVAHVRINRFAERTGEELRQALTDARAAGARAIVLDLRNNPGGLVNQLITVAGQFLPPGTTVLLEQNRAGQTTPYTTSGRGLATDLPLVVLVNRNSASAAEILAGALADNGRAEIVGVRTFGTATVLRPFDLEGGGQVRLGIAQWLTPNGEVVRNIGIEPTEPVALPIGVDPLTPTAAAALGAAVLQSDDAQLVRALELLGVQSRSPGTQGVEHP
jgi:carboxyl-terminal processing protease